MMPRIASFSDEIIRVPSFILLPTKYADRIGRKDGSVIHKFTKNIQNLDIAPTIAAALGYENPNLRGANLLPVLFGQSNLVADRQIVTLNTNEWRQWTPHGFSMIVDQNQLIYDTKFGVRCLACAPGDETACNRQPITCSSELLQSSDYLYKIIKN